MKDCYMIVWTLIILLILLRENAAEEAKDQSSTDNISSFVKQLTSLLNQGAFGQAYQGLQYPENLVGGAPGRPGYRPKPGRPYYPRPGRPFPPGRPLPPGGPFPRPGEPFPPGPFPRPGEPLPPPGRPFPPGPFPRPGEPLPLPGRPFPAGGPYPPPGGPYPPPGINPGGYPGQGGLYPPTSLMGALSSIARYDDLRCVPRLLCEVASGARPGNDYTQQSVVPFVSKDALVTLLTVLNFVDDSPLLVFGRAALLGYTAQGDSRACLGAYPTCPREPDRLVEYLNNHNGGFFRFFNQQIPQYAPQYQQYQPNPGHPSPFPQPNPSPYPQPYPSPYPQPNPSPFPFRKYPQRSEYYPQQYSAQNQKYYQSRIQTKPESILEYNYYTSQTGGSHQEQLTLSNLEQDQNYYSPDQVQDYYSGLDQEYYYQPDQDQDNRLTFSDYQYQDQSQYDPNLQSQDQPINQQFQNQPVNQQYQNQAVNQQYQNQAVNQQYQNQAVNQQYQNEAVNQQYQNQAVNQQYQNQAANQQYQSTKLQVHPLVFPKSDSVTGQRGGKGLSFPSDSPTRIQSIQRPQKAVTMIFPDRTGTGDLRLDVDQHGGYKTVYFHSNQKQPVKSSIFRDQRGAKETVAFPKDGAVNDRHKYGKGRPTMHFPE